MKAINVKLLLPLVLSLLIAFAFGCILDPKEDIKKPPDPTDNFKDLTNREDVVTNLLESYKKRDDARFAELLHDEYLWYMQTRDLQPGEEQYWSRSRDIEATHFIFENAVRLELTITPHEWMPLTELGGEPCEDCWETQREYYITAQFQPEGTIYNGNDLVKFVIVPVNDAGDGGRKEYRLRLAYDIEN